MNAWTIYWILQLDSIREGLMILTVMLALLAGFAALFGTIQSSSCYRDDDPDIAAGKAKQAMAAKWMKPVLALFVLTLFIPTTKTVAAMVIIPAIANNETIRKESGELYDLAKQALRDAVTDKAKDAAKEAAK